MYGRHWQRTLLCEMAGTLAPTRTHSASFRNNRLYSLHKGTVGKVLLLPHFTEKKTEMSPPPIPEIMATLIHCFIFLQSRGGGGTEVQSHATSQGHGKVCWGEVSSFGQVYPNALVAGQLLSHPACPLSPGASCVFNDPLSLENAVSVDFTTSA